MDRVPHLLTDKAADVLPGPRDNSRTDMGNTILLARTGLPAASSTRATRFSD